MYSVGKRSVLLIGSALFGLWISTVANQRNSHADPDWQWQQIESLFPHAPGTRWVYALSGRLYPHGGELQVEVKGRQHIPHLKHEALLTDETHPSEAPGEFPEVVPVLYYPREGYLVRDTAYIYSNPQRTSLVSTGNLGEAVAPILPLRPQHDGTDWQPVQIENWGTASRLSIAYQLHSQKETVTTTTGKYADCVRVEGTVAHGDGSGYRYQEWYAPGVGLVKSLTTSLRDGKILLQKELVRFHGARTRGEKG